MKILFLARLFSPHIGGVEKHVLEIGKRLVKSGHDVTVITESLADSKKEETIEGIRIFRIPVGKNERKKKFRIWSWLIKNKYLIKNADITHCHDVFFWYLPFKLLYPNKKIFTTFHGYESYPLTRKQIWMHRFAEKLSLGNICIGDFIPKWYGTIPTYISYGGITIPRKIGYAINKHTALFIGRLDEQTSILEYNAAYKLIKQKLPKFELTVAGDGPYRSQLDKRIKVLGFVNIPEEHFKECNFAFVSRYLAVLEAMVARKLVFALYDNPIKRDYLQLAPFSKSCIITDSPQELARLVLYYLANPKIAEKKVEKAFNWVKTQTWENMTITYLKLWELKN